ncbi:MAG TPA: protein-disulfide reductase, partial [Chitinophagaceae bacterium]|nr:protein-disulfide reductase [Chitinophagaceae bacterium]
MFRKSKRLIAFFTGILFSVFAQGQEKPVSFKYQQEVKGTEGSLTIKAVIKEGSKLYSIKSFGAEAPINTQISFDSTSRKFLDETIIESGNAKTEKDASFNTTVTFFTDSVQWQQKLIIADKDTAVISGTLTYFVKTGEEYNNYEEPFKVTVIKAAERNNDNVAGGKGSLNDNLKNRSLFWIFLASFGGGLLAVITPCVFSMVPVTVSFFTKRSKTRAEGVKNAFFYSASIIIIFTLLGLLITLIFGPAA